MNDEYRLYLYPISIRNATNIAESFADELDYDDSFVHDEFPDKEYLGLMLDKLHFRLKNELKPDNHISFSHMCDVADAVFVNQIFLRRQDKMWQ